MKRLFPYIMILGGAFLCSAQLYAQSDSLLMEDYSFVKTADPWLTSQNAGGLTRFAISHLSNAQISIEKQSGHFHDISQSPNALDLEAKVESFYRLTHRIVMYGSMSYNNFSGHDMAGSYFINSSRMPFDLIEDSLTNAGKKHLDTYNLTGAISYDICKSIVWGAKMDFTAANLAKYKDLRHRNSLMDITFTTGFYIPVKNILSLGINYYYRRHTESIAFSLYGSEDKNYRTLIEYGAYMGIVETFGENGYTDKNTETPFFCSYHGIGAQLGLNITSRLSWYNDFTYRHRSGYYGKKSTYSISHNQHESRGYEYKGRLSLKQATSLHSLDIAVDIENLENFSNSYRNERDKVSTANYYQYFTPTKMANKVWANGGVTYTGHYGIRHLLPTWTLTAGYLWGQRKQTAYIYPYFRRQHLKTTEWTVQANRNIQIGKGILGILLGFSFHSGTGDICYDGIMAPPSDKQTAPAEMTAYLHRNYTYLTAPQYKIRTAVKYSFIFPKTRMKTYAVADFTYHKSNDSDIYMEGHNRTLLRASIGCTF